METEYLKRVLYAAFPVFILLTVLVQADVENQDIVADVKPGVFHFAIENKRNFDESNVVNLSANQSSLTKFVREFAPQKLGWV